VPDHQLSRPPPQKSSCSHGDADSVWWRCSSRSTTHMRDIGTVSHPFRLRALSPPSPLVCIIDLDAVHGMKWPPLL
jgi:hypothetical protein